MMGIQPREGSAPGPPKRRRVAIDAAGRISIRESDVVGRQSPEGQGGGCLTPAYLVDGSRIQAPDSAGERGGAAAGSQPPTPGHGRRCEMAAAVQMAKPGVGPCSSSSTSTREGGSDMEFDPPSGGHPRRRVLNTTTQQPPLHPSTCPSIHPRYVLDGGRAWMLPQPLHRNDDAHTYVPPANRQPEGAEAKGSWTPGGKKSPQAAALPDSSGCGLDAAAHLVTGRVRVHSEARHFRKSSAIRTGIFLLVSSNESNESDDSNESNDSNGSNDSNR